MIATDLTAAIKRQTGLFTPIHFIGAPPRGALPPKRWRAGAHWIASGEAKFG
jgi:hypothetical protein